MAVKIRLSRVGSKNNPHYRIVIKPARSKRDGESLEVLGHYNSITKEVNFKKDRVDYWLSVGAQKTQTVKRILGEKKDSKEKSDSKKEAAKSEEKSSKKAASTKS